MSCPPDTHPVAYNDLPAYCKLVYQKLAFHKTDAASIQLFTQNYFLRIPVNFQDAFSIAVMVSGWQRAGMYPYCLRTLLNHCVIFWGLEDDKAERLIEGVLSLVEDAKLPGNVSDHSMATVLNPLGYYTPILDMDNRVLNQQRALWLNRSFAIEHRRKHLEKKNEAIIKASNLKEARANKALIKAASNLLVVEHPDIEHIRIFIPPAEFDHIDCQTLCCGNEFKIGCVDWKCCKTLNCSYTACNKKLCIRNLTKHALMCAARAIVRK